MALKKGDPVRTKNGLMARVVTVLSDRWGEPRYELKLATGHRAYADADQVEAINMLDRIAVAAAGGDQDVLDDLDE